MSNYSTTICSYSNPLEVIKNGEIIILEYPVATNVNYQWGSSTCVATISEINTASTTMTYGDILISFFLFLLILGSVFSFIIYHFVTKRPAK
jgi:hypothetical protein